MERQEMMTLEDIRQNQDLVNAIDWDMTPEEAVTLYLEWGNNWSHGRMVKSKKDVSYYFVIYTWINPPKVILIRRNSEEAVELGEFDIPGHLLQLFRKSVGQAKGVFAIEGAIKEWLMKELNAYAAPINRKTSQMSS
jgi:hypothetical protein